MKILVTGANGLLGQKLCHLLLQSGEDVLATSIGDCRISNTSQPLHYQALDVCDLDQVTAVFSSWNPEVVIHTAAMTNVDQCENDKDACRRLNVGAVENLVLLCERQGVKLIHLSTDFIFDGLNGPYSEEDKPEPISFYGQSKLDAEDVIRKSDLSWSILRTVLVYGVTEGMSRSNIVLWVKESLEKGNPIRVVDDQWRTPTLAEDLAMGCYLAVKNPDSGVFHISGDEMMTPYDIAVATADFFQLDKTLISRVNATTFSQPAKRPARTGFIIEKARKILGYQPSTFIDGLTIVKNQL